jgi:hypothetical protein
MEGFIPREQVINMLLDLRNTYTDLFDGYTGDVLIKQFQDEMDLELKELTE